MPMDIPPKVISQLDQDHPNAEGRLIDHETGSTVTTTCPCGAPIPAAGPSPDYCSPQCQYRIMAQGLDPIPTPARPEWRMGRADDGCRCATSDDPGECLCPPPNPLAGVHVDGQAESDRPPLDTDDPPQAEAHQPVTMADLEEKDARDVPIDTAVLQPRRGPRRRLLGAWRRRR